MPGLMAELMTTIALVMPAPTPAPTVHLGTPCPYTAIFTSGCYYPAPAGGEGGELYVQDAADKWSLAHELGHAIDFLDLDDGERRRIMAVIGWRAWHREAFADIYAGCKLGADPTKRSSRLEGIFHYVKPRRVPAICRLIARAGTSVAGALDA